MNDEELTTAQYNEYHIITNMEHKSNVQFKKQLENQFRSRKKTFEDIVKMAPGEYTFYCARFAQKDEIKPEITLKLNRLYMDWKNMPFQIGFSLFFCVLGQRSWKSNSRIRGLISSISQNSLNVINFALPIGAHFGSMRYYWLSLNNYYLELKDAALFDLESSDKYEELYNKIVYS